MLQLSQVHKRFGRVPALAGLDLSLARGEVYGLLGPSGAGKSTALRVIAGLVAADGGQVLICGVDRAAQPGLARRLIGAQVDQPAWWGHLTCQDNLVLLAGLQGAPAGQVASLLRAVGLQAQARCRADAVGRGARQRLALAAALLGEPQLLVLDEPTAGLDPRRRAALLGSVRAVARDRGLTVLLTGHGFAEIAAVCDRAGMLDDGRLIHEGPAASAGELRERYFALTGAEGSA